MIIVIIYIKAPLIYSVQAHKNEVYNRKLQVQLYVNLSYKYIVYMTLIYSRE